MLTSTNSDGEGESFNVMKDICSVFGVLNSEVFGQAKRYGF